MNYIFVPTYFPITLNFQYFLKVKNVIWADTFPYSGQSFQNRTKIRTPEGFQWLTVPLKAGKSGKAQHDVLISEASDWRRQHFKSIENYYRASPYFDFVAPDLSDLFEASFTHLSDLNWATFELLCRWMGLDLQVKKLSEFAPHVNSLAGVKAHFEDVKWLCNPQTAPYFETVGLGYQVLDLPEKNYRQVFGGFESGMSALDLLLMYGEESVAMLG